VDQEGGSFLSGALEVDEFGNSSVVMPDDFWNTELISSNERFDFLVRGDSALLRACPYAEDEYMQSLSGPRHAGDPDFVEGSVCGLTKWVCAGCGVGTIVESEDDFPDGWYELSQKRADGDTLSFEAICSWNCLSLLSLKGASALREVGLPGFRA